MLPRILSMLKSFQVQDIFDIAIIAVMISALLVWFKDRASRFVLFGIGVLGLIYMLARLFQLYLTTLVLQGFFASLLFVLVVIFQEDLRRFFERLALWGRFKIKLRDATSSTSSAEILAHTADNLARQRIGALMVLAGKDPLDRHLTGGVRLDGLLSESLLESIFDPHSRGHDGAVIIRDNRIEQFGCHLPLTSNIHPKRRYGLRHTAALGLSERSDALCIVVSEERGAVSVARKEKLNAVANAAELRNILEKFFAQTVPARPHHPILAWLKKNPKEKALALLLAFIFWITFGYQRDSVRRDFTVPIEYVNLAPDRVLEGSRATEAMVTLTGPSQAFQLLSPHKLRVSIDLEKVETGKQDIPLTGSMVTLPVGLTVNSIKPEHISISVSKVISADLFIEAVIDSPPSGWTVQQTLISPPFIRILFPDRLRSKRLHIKTEPIQVRPTEELQVHNAKLVLPADVRVEDGKIPTVTVTVKLQKKVWKSSSHSRKSSPEASQNASN
ncbi:TIGR00159 family protein [Syntrophus gentianae]|uniref:Diadenylate cyclase n=1 Tax=Syntrophus gentianae TaxID=43775 RepID=A0A1H7W490_9BACT|nr:diadenylate cyclase [Syntrophus gentianae]SEM15787.1 TIGR00159 family protein [Syntrophus gentianae]